MFIITWSAMSFSSGLADAKAGRKSTALMACGDGASDADWVDFPQPHHNNIPARTAPTKKIIVFIETIFSFQQSSPRGEGSSGIPRRVISQIIHIRITGRKTRPVIVQILSVNGHHRFGTGTGQAGSSPLVKACMTIAKSETAGS